MFSLYYKGKYLQILIPTSFNCISVGVANYKDLFTDSKDFNPHYWTL